MVQIAPRLVVVAHGTASVAGRNTTSALIDSVRAARPSVPVELSFLDVVSPRLESTLDRLSGPSVVVPLLLSTGYHVQTDIPAIAARHPSVRVARHLGPHPLLTDVLVDRLGPVPAAGSLVLVGAGSSRAEAVAELRAAADGLAERTGRDVTVLTMGDPLRTRLAELDGPVQVATYLLAEGRFTDVLAEATDGLGVVAAPLGVHPALVELVWRRYDEAVEGPLCDTR
jgi:sirohydrochlorin ferrochelatase